MPRDEYSDEALEKKDASVQSRGISPVCLSLESVWRPPELMAGHWHHFTIRGKWGFKVEISLIAFYQLNPQHTPGATSGACHGTDSSLIWLTFRATSWENWGDVALA